MISLKIMALLWILFTVQTARAKTDDALTFAEIKEVSSVSGEKVISQSLGQNGCASKDSITVSLLTCWPGPEVYELCGHEAVRIRGAEVDSVWNYGVFSFDEPNFVYRFVKGETDYMLWGYPSQWFFDEYRIRGSKVVEQDLNLSQDEAWALRKILQNESLPANRVYRYNYVKDNCATRIVARMDSAFGPVAYSDEVKYGTFRNTMRHYHKNYPWYQFGIDLALGSGLDYPLAGREEMFAPLEMMDKVASASLPDGRQLVAATRVVVEGLNDVTLPPTPWWRTPMFIMSLLLGCCVGVAVYELRKRIIIRWIYSVYYAIVGITGIIIAYLVFVSTHEATSPNLMLLLFNPLQLLFAVCVWWRKSLCVAQGLSLYNIFIVGGLFLIWPFQTQSANPAFFPLMFSSVALSIPYAIITLRKSYNYVGTVFAYIKGEREMHSMHKYK